ncbi:hypothetical protein A5703_09930 [Mycobacterium sp. E188]|nr:hypothetical protein A5703_09930 [Mycobacterium sp. E188]OBH44584.1 hypothetical protein A5691_01370 [Mycobacterium sp. E183]
MCENFIKVLDATFRAAADKVCILCKIWKELFSNPYIGVRIATTLKQYNLALRTVHCEVSNEIYCCAF